ncbi:hypothetical protein GobsT_37830 [Gemmata obscuriglobus]|uniref:Uncharacterized protein n=1 Tax=Gemmata obscuriglobus TaxID=114 RepID=A0A2Z3GWK4_9BACT|nr:hypothetical protein [Gemmata obscuriglobus]AWM38123.1 hypothetical protein C1280_14720 [Gemmata obscuriglobus]QEG28994.1 hypothetical protein GobsT_37830 [Gemmata obscuriglobus]VTS07563.1 unnamed protein product [Gemmata obscuriglobus UQM 2246]
MDTYREWQREQRAMRAALARLKAGGRYWLDRHVRGWGEVEVLPALDPESCLARVRDLSDGGEYPADPRGLRPNRPDRKK